MSDKISGDGWELYMGDCLEILPTLEAESVDAEYFNIAHQRIANASGDYMPTEKEKASNQPSLLW